MSRSKLLYDICQQSGHDEQFLNFVCVDQFCKQKGSLLCQVCQEENHKKCVCLELYKFIKQFNDQLRFGMSDEHQSNTYQLLNIYDSLLTIAKSTQVIVQKIFDQLLQIIQGGKDRLINIQLQQQVKLNKFQTNCSKEAFTALISEIECYGPNTQQFNFTIKAPNNVLEINNVEARSENAQKYLIEFQESMNNLTKNLKDWQQEFFIPLQHFFLSENECLIKEELNYIQDLNQEFRILTQERKIIKLIYLDQNTIAGIGGNQLSVFQVSNQQILFQQQTFEEITDIAYDSQIIYLATKKGEVMIFKGAKFQSVSILQVDAPGTLHIQIKNNRIITIGKEFIKIWSEELKTLKKQRKIDNESVFHINENVIYIGKESLQIWDYINDKLQLMSLLLEGKLISISTHQKKLILAYTDKIQVHDKGITHSMQFQNIKQIQILSQFPVILVACSHTGVYMYNYQVNTVQKFFEESVEALTVSEFHKIYYLAFGKENGKCVTGKLEREL